MHLDVPKRASNALAISERHLWDGITAYNADAVRVDVASREGPPLLRVAAHRRHGVQHAVRVHPAHQFAAEPLVLFLPNRCSCYSTAVQTIAKENDDIEAWVEREQKKVKQQERRIAKSAPHLQQCKPKTVRKAQSPFLLDATHPDADRNQHVDHVQL